VLKFRDKVQVHLDELEAEYIEKLRAYMTPLIQAEFDRVRKKNRKLERIIFGNGDYLMVGYEGLRDEEDCPSYMRKLIYLCDLVSFYAIDDVYPS